MNKYIRRLALFLISRELKKHEKRAFKAQKKANGHNVPLTNFMDNHSEYRRLRFLKMNIEEINNPWQGAFAYYWTKWPKNDKYIQKFPEFDLWQKWREMEEVPLSENDQAWADMTNEEFFRKLDEE